MSAEKLDRLLVGSPLDRVLRALNHPLRRRILRELGSGPASASSLAKVFDEELGAVSYHLNQVLARECGVVELVDTIARRGALEKIYGLDKTIWAEVSSSSELGGAGCEWFPVEVDSPTWHEICEARRDFQDRVSAAVERVRQREEQGRQLRRFIVAVATFPTVAPSEGSH
ncbi:MAG TPA: helix-turn-helix domain-containing protein [Solirubrobacterales bacterium]|nr:helix-turn-helix domain-containing protein [Solirubrobacterales bacterium]